jgi:hypothetical protein
VEQRDEQARGARATAEQLYYFFLLSPLACVSVDLDEKIIHET